MNTVRTDGLCFAESTYAPGDAMPEHAHPEACVTLILRGHIEERAGHRELSVGAASIGIKPFDLEHSDRFGPTGARTLKLKMEREFVDRLAEFGRPLRRWRWVPLGAAAPVLLRMRTLLDEAGEEPADRLEDRAIELLAALHQDDRLRERPTPPAWLREIRREVVGRFREGVRTRELAERAGVHPVYLARAFRGSYGESISDCVRRLRVCEAARQLHRSGASASRAVFPAGFADQSHLTRTFRRETGMTPTRWRTL